LRAAAEDAWREHAVPHRAASADVWDLVRRRALLRDVLGSVPTGGVLLVVAGSPCQQLTTFSRDEGHQGLGGPDSAFFFAVPTLCWVVEQIRPDVAVHCVVENAGSMLPFHRGIMCSALCVADDPHYGPRIDARRWTVFPRDRTWVGTFPQEPTRAPQRRRPPWESGWQPHPAGRMPTMMRSRSRRLPVPSAYQLAPGHLIYHTDGRFARLNLAQVGAEIRRLLPERLRGDWDMVLGHNACHGTFGAGLGEWLVEHGPRIGVRPPTIAERSRALGWEDYEGRLGLAPVALFDAQGNAFDQDALG